jgi:crotonobetainyl-CoA:carnitine CoA-transferase CaiB-like acyl-CoA transferase
MGAALVKRSITGRGQYLDVSVHESCALTTEGAVTRYIYMKQIVRRQTGRHASPAPTDRTQHICSDGKYVNVAAQILNRLTVERLHVMRDWMKEQGLPTDLIEEKLRDPEIITDNELFLYLIANMPRNDVYHGGQRRGMNMGAVWSPDEVMEDPHLEDRGFWTEVEYPEVGMTLCHAGPAAIFNGSPWRISRRAPLIGEHNEEVLCGELGLSRTELSVLAEGGVV